jgi:hypothetical protein
MMLLCVIGTAICEKSLNSEKSHFSVVVNFVNTAPIYVKKYSKDAQKYSTTGCKREKNSKTSIFVKICTCVMFL